MRSIRRHRRLEREKPLVAKYFPGAEFHDFPGGTYLDFRTGRNGWRYDYLVRVVLSPDYPDEQPNLFIESPRILPMRGGDEAVNDVGLSHVWHTDVNHTDTRVKLCYTDDWDASMSCVFVLWRGVLWLWAYENYLNTGETIAEYFDRLRNEIGD